ncbi:hypothetical protein [Actinoplanes sp. NPDC049118]|uniref:hypothetical protein n=1 Tax=Actinoplanes sp. NPDC049118 TaxID=3155769 RepID=UPI00340D99FA
MTTVPRPITKLTDDQQKLLAEAVKAAKKSDQSQARADADKEAAWEAILTARAGGVPDDRLCDETGFNRSTLNRRFGTRSKES